MNMNKILSGLAVACTSADDGSGYIQPDRAICDAVEDF